MAQFFRAILLLELDYNYRPLCMTFAIYNHTIIRGASLDLSHRAKAVITP